MKRAVVKLAIAVLALQLVLAGCSTSQASLQSPTRELADSCSALSHISLTHLEVAAASGQRSGDAALEREATRLQIDLKGAHGGGGVAVIIDAANMITRCRQLKAWP